MLFAATVAEVDRRRKRFLALAASECQNGAVRREFSAGGAVVRRIRGEWRLAAIRPGGRSDVWALPKGNIGPGERSEDAAAREVLEETGLDVRLVEKLGDVRYVYTWDGERIFKIVSFFLFRYRTGALGRISPEHAHEVAEARWLALADAPRLLSYGGERSIAAKALARVTRDGDPL